MIRQHWSTNLWRPLLCTYGLAASQCKYYSLSSENSKNEAWPCRGPVSYVYLKGSLYRKHNMASFKYY